MLHTYRSVAWRVQAWLQEHATHRRQVLAQSQCHKPHAVYVHAHLLQMRILLAAGVVVVVVVAAAVAVAEVVLVVPTMVACVLQVVAVANTQVQHPHALPSERVALALCSCVI